jgi:hypothetical protein
VIPILSQPNPVKITLSSHLCPCLSSSLFPHAICTRSLYVVLFFHAFYIPCPSHPPWLDYSNYTLRRVQDMKFLLYSFLQSLLISALFRPNILLSTLFSNTPVYAPPLMSETTLHNHTEPQAKLCFVYTQMVTTTSHLQKTVIPCILNIGSDVLWRHNVNNMQVTRRRDNKQLWKERKSKYWCENRKLFDR